MIASLSQRHSRWRYCFTVQLQSASPTRMRLRIFTLSNDKKSGDHAMLTSCWMVSFVVMDINGISHVDNTCMERDHVLALAYQQCVCALNHAIDTHVKRLFILREPKYGTSCTFTAIALTISDNSERIQE